MAGPSLRVTISDDFDAWMRGFATTPVVAPQVGERFWDARMDAFFERTQENVHVVTGALKASGRKVTEIVGGNVEGEVEYGGGLVDYAWYENRRGGEHAFIERSWAEVEAEFAETLPQVWLTMVLLWK